MRTKPPVRLALMATLTVGALAAFSGPPHAISGLTPTGATTATATGTPSGPVTSAAEAPAHGIPALGTAARPVGVARPVPFAGTAAVRDTGIPAVAQLAYQRAATVIGKVDHSCGLDWTLLAALGRVESDHGRHGGAVLGDDGVSTPVIRGVALDGTGHVAKVLDTDAGAVDGDTRWDRAVGPMQFLPSTWAVVGVDADGDGERSADDIDDAALGAAVYLCAAPGDLTDPDALRAALLRYNPSDAYVDQVLEIQRAYLAGDYELTGGPSYDAAPAVSTVAEVAPTAGLAATGLPGDPGPQATGGDHDPDGHHAHHGHGGHHGDGLGHQHNHQGSHHAHGTGEDGDDDAESEPPVTIPPVQTGVLTSTESGWDVGYGVFIVDDPAELADTDLDCDDPDGAPESIAEELEGLVGKPVTVEVAVEAGATPRLTAILKTPECPLEDPPPPTESPTVPAESATQDSSATPNSATPDPSTTLDPSDSASASAG